MRRSRDIRRADGGPLWMLARLLPRHHRRVASYKVSLRLFSLS